MKYGKWICLTVIGLMIFLSGEALSRDSFKELLSNCIISHFNLENDDVEIEIRSNRLDINSIAFDSLSVKPLTQSEPRGLLSFDVTLYSEGKELDRGQVRVKISYFEQVLVTTERIGRNKEITPDKYKVERMEITSLTSRPLTSDESLAGFWTKRDIRKGQILSSSSVEKIPTILSGQGVSILYKTAALEIEARGVAMESGYTGDRIRIKNDYSNKILTCTVLNSDTVELASN